MLYEPCIICVYFMSNFFVLSSQYFEKVFVSGFVILFVCFVVAESICMLCIFMTYSTS
jgi:hypothetical protein